MDRTSSVPSIMSTIQFWIRFINFGLEYWVPSSVLYYSKWEFEMRVKYRQSFFFNVGSPKEDIFFDHLL